MNGHLTTDIECPRCCSLRIIRELRPCIGMESEGDTTYMLNGSVTRCQACGYAWDRKATRGIGLKNYPIARKPEPKPSIWTRLFQRLFAFIS